MINKHKNLRYLYCLTFENGKKYYGQTSNFNNRVSRHKSNAKDGNLTIPLYNAINKYSWNNIKKEIILSCDEAIIDALEVMYIRETLHPLGYNLESGGCKNKILSEESRKKMSRSHLGYKMSENAKKKIGIFNKGKVTSKETKLKMSKASINKKKSKEHVLNNAITNGAKPFLVFKDNKLIGEWINASEASRELNLPITSAGRCLRGERKTAGGYTFKRKNI